MNLSQLTEYDTFLFHQGTNCRAYEMLGAHLTEENGEKGVRFTVWAPNAKEVSVVGEFNHWDTRVNKMSRIDDGESGKSSFLVSRRGMCTSMPSCRSMADLTS